MMDFRPLSWAATDIKFVKRRFDRCAIFVSASRPAADRPISYLRCRF
jgi:hypothetical protein